MVRMGTVWDRTTEVLRGRAGILAPIAMVAIFLPTVVNNAVSAYGQPAPGATTGATTAIGLVGIVVAIAVLLASIWGQLALLAVATDPATTRADAGRQATQRLPAAIGVVLTLLLLIVLVLLPLVIALAGAGVDFGNRGSVQSVPSSVSAFVTFYLLVLIPVGFWISARLMLVNPVVLNERRGLRAIRRSFDLTRGLALRIVGVMLLFVVVLVVATLAVQGVSALLFRVVLGGDALPTVAFLVGTIGAVVTTALSVVAAVFTAQLYVAVAGERQRLADTFS